MTLRRGVGGLPDGTGGRFMRPEVTGWPVAKSRKARPCPRCGAKPGQSCVRRSNGRVSGQDIGGGYEKVMKGFHRERTMASTADETTEGSRHA